MTPNRQDAASETAWVLWYRPSVRQKGVRRQRQAARPVDHPPERKATMTLAETLLIAAIFWSLIWGIVSLARLFAAALSRPAAVRNQGVEDSADWWKHGPREE